MMDEDAAHPELYKAIGRSAEKRKAELEKTTLEVTEYARSAYEEAIDNDYPFLGPYFYYENVNVILALGAMSFEDKAEKEKLDMFVNAFKKTGCRAIIQGFQKSLSDYEFPETMIACGSVPHSWFFRQGKFVIHHCGFGTSAATLIYGIPSISVPHVLDQMGFAMQLDSAGVSTKPLKSKDLSESTIINAIHEMNESYDEKLSAAQILSEKIRSEGGVREAVRLIEETMAQ